MCSPIKKSQSVKEFIFLVFDTANRHTVRPIIGKTHRIHGGGEEDQTVTSNPARTGRPVAAVLPLSGIRTVYVIAVAGHRKLKSGNKSVSS